MISNFFGRKLMQWSLHDFGAKGECHCSQSFQGLDFDWWKYYLLNSIEQNLLDRLNNLIWVSGLVVNRVVVIVPNAMMVCWVIMWVLLHEFGTTSFRNKRRLLLGVISNYASEHSNKSILLKAPLLLFSYNVLWTIIIWCQKYRFLMIRKL